MVITLPECTLVLYGVLYNNLVFIVDGVFHSHKSCKNWSRDDRIVNRIIARVCKFLTISSVIYL